MHAHTTDDTRFPIARAHAEHVQKVKILEKARKYGWEWLLPEDEHLGKDTLPVIARTKQRKKVLKNKTLTRLEKKARRRRNAALSKESQTGRSISLNWQDESLAKSDTGYRIECGCNHCRSDTQDKILSRRKNRRAFNRPSQIALNHNGLLNPHLLDSDSVEKTEQYFSEKRGTLPQTGYIDPRVRLELWEEPGHHFTISAQEKAEEDEHWEDYLSELSEIEDDPSDGIPSTLELSDFADYSEKDDFFCGRRIETPSYEEDWEDILSDGYDPADNERSYELHYDKMGTSGDSRHRTMTIEGQKIMAMPIAMTINNQATHCRGQSFGSAYNSNRPTLKKEDIAQQ